MANNEKQISEQLVHNYLVKRGLNKIAGEFKKEVGITKVTKLADLEDIVLHYNNIAENEKKLKLSTKDSKIKEVVSQKRKVESSYEEAPIAKRTRGKKIQIQNDYIKLLPDEILLKIMEYFSTEDILKKIAPISKKFYRLSQDQNLIKKIEYIVWDYKNLFTVVLCVPVHIAIAFQNETAKHPPHAYWPINPWGGLY